MAKGPRYKVPRRRRREGKTNYYKRYRMIVSGHPRFIVRKTLNYIWVQVATARPEGDVIIAAAHSNELRKRFGWKAGTCNTSAAYLTGLLAALRALEKGVEYAVPDIGLHRPVKGALVFAAIKAANDAGLKVPMGGEVAPSEERIRGEHIASYAKILRENGLLEKRFSRYLANGLQPEDLPSHFEEVKNKILEAYKR
ncbi:50S ribosomal protein L18P [Desulfurococcus amylolyticus 1221n]|uniref:Large ribosomal subunit protein uL18 n=1 Tax=Desulfurococcus amylolyticus (strain DSM 18924 / JCM 16383 / VKM B-2413 / 1221n) TaxID=490899 RepID=RL18_DESA1|nr:50S ribosomal protein L18 [Desulfurococcus amylolyticus]B8D5V1.1 RecName: Full=Large ribosomal subunit protein uL18; AltName: Full=50S ribosomal protein L18 [Desulfurococcus amylolyticus 1221n]ACL11482.1 50S ribosomal protein L18P [Desulfurococcus amylolyticus 1221n]